MLEIKNLKKSFKKKLVLNGVNLTVKNGEIIYIIGKNGCGKTTLFKLISDIIEKDDGIIFFDKNVSIGALIENPTFIENEDILFNLKFLSTINKNYDIDIITKLCEIFDLDINYKGKLKSYSLGMRQKLGIIQAIMENQNLILFDEPVRGLDQEGIKIFVELVNNLSLEGKSIIISSHEYIENINFTKFYELKDGILYEKNKY